MIVRILIDNLTKSDLVPEWGLAVYVEYNGHQILLDTGSVSYTHLLLTRSYMPGMARL